MGEFQCASVDRLKDLSSIYEYESNIMSLEWWQKNVVYHIYLPSFKDSNADGIGDFQGLISKLDYFEELNVKTLQLSPFYPSPMKDNGYDISSYVDVDPVFGSMQDFDQFMEEIKKRDLNIIVDLVANHTSCQHIWFEKSVQKEEPFSDYYVWANENPKSTKEQRFPPNNWLSVFGGSAWTWNEQRKQFYLHQFLPEQPDLNFRNPAVVEEIKMVMSFWLEKGVDGFRIDAASHLFEDERLRDEPISKNSKAKKNEHKYLDHIYTKGLEENFGLLKEFRTVLDEFESKTGKSKIMVAEVMEEIEDVMKYYGAVGDRIADFPFNFQLYKLKSTSTAVDLYEIINWWLSNMPKGKYPNWVVSSHDESRVISRVGRRLGFSLTMVMMLLPGIPLCYYGDEIGMENTKMKNEEIRDSFALRTSPENSRDPMRTPMQWNSEKNAGFSDSNRTWLPINSNYKTVNVEVETSDTYSFLNLFKHLLNLREEPSVLVGLLIFPLVNGNIFSMLRYLEHSKCFLLVLNMSDKPVCSNLCNASPFLPKEGVLEISSRHINPSDDESITNEETDAFKCNCCDQNILNLDRASGSTVNEITVSLKSIHLQAKEAIVLSFIGKQKL